MKTAIMYYDTERKKYRVCIGKKQKTHIGRYDDYETARIVMIAASKAYIAGKKGE